MSGSRSPLVPPGIEDDPGDGFDPDEVILDSFDPCRIFRDDAERVASFFLENYAPEIDDPIPHRNRQTVSRYPSHLRQLRIDLLEDLIITGRLARRLLERLCERAEQVGTADDADKSIAVQHRDAFDTPALHQLHNLIQCSVLRDADD